ncbi:hypothetical protein JTB14_012675 [Gonioctena quinquepunctata]|nr:hypothetical protein JTB14_012675 [Gonioctena quinquepunctata]
MCRKLFGVSTVKYEPARNDASPVGVVMPLPTKLEHVHIEIVIMPLVDGYRYCITMDDKFSGWPDAITLHYQHQSYYQRNLKTTLTLHKPRGKRSSSFNPTLLLRRCLFQSNGRQVPPRLILDPTTYPDRL